MLFGVVSRKGFIKQYNVSFENPHKLHPLSPFLYTGKDGCIYTYTWWYDVCVYIYMYIGSVAYIYIYISIWIYYLYTYRWPTYVYMSMPMTHRLASGTQGRESCRRHRPGTGGAIIFGGNALRMEICTVIGKMKEWICICKSIDVKDDSEYMWILRQWWYVDDSEYMIYVYIYIFKYT